MKRIISDHIPCWYELSWQPKPPALLLRVHQDFVTAAGNIPDEAPIVRDFSKKFKFRSFSGDFSQNFGFERVFKRKGVKNNFDVFEIAIPKLKSYSSEPCKWCKGTKYDELREDKCYHCSGTGKEKIINQNQAYAISATLTVFTLFARYPESETTAGMGQHIVIQTSTIRKTHGGSLSGELSKQFMHWIRSHGPGELPEVLEAMKVAHKKMWLKADWFMGFVAQIMNETGLLILKCPGNACYIGAS
jgi:hypothetical protein